MKQWIMPAILVFSLCVSFAVVGLMGELAGIWVASILPVSAWYVVERRRATKSLFAAVILISFIAVAFTVPTLTVVTPNGNVSDGKILGLKKFSSYDELKNFVETNFESRYYSYGDGLPDITVTMVPATTALAAPESDFSFTVGGSTDFSTTNIQVQGVDEADIVKCDGKYLYVVTRDKVVIIDAYPPNDARILSEIQENENLNETFFYSPTINEIFINENKLVVLGWNFAKVYDVSDRENPVLRREIYFDGGYFNSRMIGDYVYLITTLPQYVWMEEEIDLPNISCNGDVKTVPATDIYYFENLYDYSYQFTTIMAINTQNDGEEITSETFLMTAAQNLFVSSNNIYITYTDYLTYLRDGSDGATYQETEKTTIHKIEIADGRIEYKSQGEVPGRVLNQFSMDEYQGYFRIATTTGGFWNGVAQNHIYVLDEDLNITGRLENLAPGEEIYSARFMGSRAYLVTFKKIDPLFVIDLSDPANPEVLGELKIPGYSDYLHPYDETHIIGVGKDTADMGSFAWYQGVKIALFDVSDPENPMEISKYVIGDRGTDSYALYDHRAFLFSRSKNLLVIPVQLAEIDEGDYPEGVPPDAYGEYVWQGAYVFDISLTDGLVLKGGITHSEGGFQPEWYWYDSCFVKRSLYINNVLYTISDNLVKMNDLNDLNEINEVGL